MRLNFFCRNPNNGTNSTAKATVNEQPQNQRKTFFVIGLKLSKRSPH